MVLKKDIFSPAEFWIESKFTAGVSCNGCQGFLETSLIWHLSNSSFTFTHPLDNNDPFSSL
jgi:hypothetical protein